MPWLAPWRRPITLRLALVLVPIRGRLALFRLRCRPLGNRHRILGIFDRTVPLGLRGTGLGWNK